ncbi:hypothetical protein B9479_006512 [Cryptococcus floricola]|uniref:Uncharacterized protein n=1 Tax=Cryptococcus floricola TaxID=2591691 RepID=A0A5D3AMZ7_9TREE|nr:hypothetical protein B9479_006512 [Cryptococcus floricola]
MSLDTQPHPSLLIPTNPANTSNDAHPRGGILLNRSAHARRPSDPFFIDTSHSHTGPASASGSGSGSNHSLAHATSQPVRILSPPPVSAGGRSLDVSGSPATSPILGSSASSATHNKIRFAPLPDPRYQRSLSTGRNVALRSGVDPDGVETRHLELQNMDDEYAVDDDDDDDEDEDQESRLKRGRSWSKDMGLKSGWKGTKKLLRGKNPISSKDKEDGGYQGEPLTRSSSTGGIMGRQVVSTNKVSPFRWTVETERKKDMLGTPPASARSLLSANRPDSLYKTQTPPSPTLKPSSSGHHRTSSIEARPSSSLGASPAPVKMLNGRVYGSRRASEAAEREKEYRQKLEPAFVEWGSAGVGAGAPVVAKTSGRGAFLGDEDDGGGMAWVKKRREEREKRRSVENALQVAGEVQETGSASHSGGLSPSQSSTSSFEQDSGKPALDVRTDIKTPDIDPAQLPSHSPTIVASPHDRTDSPINLSRQAEEDGRGMTISETVNEKSVKQAMVVPSDKAKKAQDRVPFTDPFSEDHQFANERSGSEDEEDEGDEDEEEEDGDFDDDDDEEELDAVRTTSSAAGVEVISRHKD